MGFLDKAKDWLSHNPDKAAEAIEKAGDLIDDKTQGRFADKVDKVQEAARDFVEKQAVEKQAVEQQDQDKTE
ncbi:antitoxin [uncultured Mycolicibacterium sp.]|uniref:antitoxin n=1 Tax=uncultured Mycolicibacterium sp. TaxID=2320817 RepID=UPI002608AD72|nr:antitoxin [uncultured Mycolicibacterium sp.]